MLVGIVGKPSSGKSTFINALCKSHIAETGNYPFTTIDPNIGVGYAYKNCICREMLSKPPYCDLCISEDQRPIPIKVIDVAGLVPGAHEGKGLGNQFLSDLAQADVLLHIVDSSGSLNEQGEEVASGSHDPVVDVLFLEEEINQWIAGILQNGWDKAKRTARSTQTPLDDILSQRLTGIKINRMHVKKVLTESSLNFSLDLEKWDSDELLRFAREIRNLSKPMIVIANKIDRPGAPNNYLKLKSQFPDMQIIPASALAENALQNLHNSDKIEYDQLKGSIQVKELNKKEIPTIEKIRTEIIEKYGTTGIPNILNQAINILDYITAFPVADVTKLTDKENRILPDVHLFKNGKTAKDFAGFIHQDLQDHFICGIDARTNRKLGDSYIVKDRDVIKIMTSK